MQKIFYKISIAFLYVLTLNSALLIWPAPGHIDGLCVLAQELSNTKVVHPILEVAPGETSLKYMMDKSSIKKMINLSIPKNAVSHWRRDFAEVETKAASFICITVKGLTKEQVVQLLGEPVSKKTSSFGGDTGSTTISGKSQQVNADNLLSLPRVRWVYLFGGSPVVLSLEFNGDKCFAARADASTSQESAASYVFPTSITDLAPERLPASYRAVGPDSHVKHEFADIPKILSDAETFTNADSDELINKLLKVHKAKLENSRKFVEAVKAGLQLCPRSFLCLLVENKCRVSLGFNVTTVLPSLKKIHPTGHGDVTTYDGIAALFTGKKNTIVMGESSRSGQSYLPNLFYENSAMHEVGHALDKYLGYASNSPEFVHAYTFDSAALPSEDRGPLSYYLQRGRRGRSECFAAMVDQLYAYRSGWRTTYMPQYFPKCYALLKNILPSPERAKVQLDESTEAGHEAFEQQQYTAAEKHFRAALASAEILQRPSSIVAALNDLAELYIEQLQFAEAEPLYKRVLEIEERESGPELDREQICYAMFSLIGLYIWEYKFAEAESLCKRALDFSLQISGSEGRLFGTSKSYLASVYWYLDKLKDAEQLYAQDLSIMDKNDVHTAGGLAVVLVSLGSVYCEEAEYVKAEAMLTKGLSILERKPGKKKHDLGWGLSSLGALYAAQGKYGHAMEVEQRAVEIAEADERKANLLGVRLAGLGAIYTERGRYKQAEQLLTRSLTANERSVGLSHPTVASSLRALAVLRVQTNQCDEAVKLAKRALKIDETTYGAEHSTVANDLMTLADAYVGLQKYADAEPLLQRALRINGKIYGLDHPSLAFVQNVLAEAYFKSGRLSEAETLLKQALELEEKKLGRDHAQVASVLFNVANLYREQKKYELAEPLYVRALEITYAAFGSFHPLRAQCLDEYAVLKRNTNHEWEAQELEKKATAIRDHLRDLKPF